MTTDASRPRRRLAFPLMLFCVTLILCVLALETISWGLLRFSEEKNDDHSRMYKAMRQREKDRLHPFVGYLGGPVPWGNARPDPLARDSNPFGISPHVVVTNGRKPCLTIAVFGGSVAEAFAIGGGSETLVSVLRRSTAFQGRCFRVVVAATYGYRQPRQLNYLLLLLLSSYRIDMAINIDGFNEVVLPFVENLPAGLPLAYPTGWLFSLREQPSWIAAAEGRIAWLRSSKKRIDESLDVSLLSFSATRRLLQRRLDSTLDRLIFEEQHKILAGGNAKHRERNVKRRVPLDQLVDIWEESSILMDQVCRANAIRYYHFLQPNLRVPGSKPWSRPEQHLLKLSHPYAKPATAGYPVLSRAGRRLLKTSVKFEDLSMLFRKTRPPVYRDACCHLNDLGNRIMGERIAEVILSDLDALPDQRTLASLRRRASTPHPAIPAK